MRRSSQPSRLSRRRFLAGAGAAALALETASVSRAAQASGSLIARVRRPPQLETPADQLDLAITPTDVFFLRSHFDPPVRELVDYKLEISGPGARTLALTPEQLAKLPQVEVIATLQCSGNGRAFFRAKAPGIQWERGAVGTARWQGVRLSRLLTMAGLTKAGRHVLLSGFDVPPHPGTPRFVRSIPIERALDPSTLVALGMNGEAIPDLHGGPVRLVVPCWAGHHWMKWLARIQVSDKPAEGYFQEVAYRLPREDGSGETAPITTLPVKSWITRPLDRSVLPMAVVEIRGQALSGAGAVVTVEVSTDGGRTFSKALVAKPAARGAWQRWTFRWRPRVAGPHEIVSRATDSTGAVQPRATFPNRFGYLWNGWDRVWCEVKK